MTTAVPTLLGTPTEEQWPAMAKLPDYKVRWGWAGGGALGQVGRWSVLTSLSPALPHVPCHHLPGQRGPQAERDWPGPAAGERFACPSACPSCLHSGASPGRKGALPSWHGCPLLLQPHACSGGPVGWGAHGSPHLPSPPPPEPAEVQPSAADIGGGGSPAPLLHRLLPSLGTPWRWPGPTLSRGAAPRFLACSWQRRGGDSLPGRRGGTRGED